MDFTGFLSDVRNPVQPQGGLLPSVQNQPIQTNLGQPTAGGGIVDWLKNVRNPVQPQGGAVGGGGGINIPTNLYPTSQRINSSSGGGSSSSNSFTGINWDSPVSAGILDQLLASAQGLLGVMDKEELK